MSEGRRTPGGFGGSAERGLRQAVSGSLISVAGLIGRPVGDGRGRVGRVADVLVHGDHDYPLVSGIAARIGLRRVRIDVEHIAAIGQRGIELSSTLVDLRHWEPGEGEMLLVRHILDHQMVDVDGVRVVRASDLYLAELEEAYALVGADVSVRTLLRRTLPGSIGVGSKPRLVLDWAQVQPFGHPDGRVSLREPHTALRTMHPVQLAELLSDLGCRQQRELLAALETGHAARTLDHLDSAHRRLLLRGAHPEGAARLMAEPDRDVHRVGARRPRRWPWHHPSKPREQETAR